MFGAMTEFSNGHEQSTVLDLIEKAAFGIPFAPT
jgi:hypothetical protein